MTMTTQVEKQLTIRLPVAASGILFFGDPANLGNVSAIAVGGVAGVVYAIAKVNQGRIEKARVAREGLQKA
jgi:GDP-mannose transporter